MQRPGSATVVLPLYGTAGVPTEVARDLAVARYALQARDIELDIMVVREDGPAAAPCRLLRDLGLPVTEVSGPRRNVGEAYLAGFRHVVERGAVDLVVTLDANGRHDAADIPRLVDQLIEDDLDVIIGSRWTRGSGTPGLSVTRWVLGKLANLAFDVVTGTRGIADATTSFRVARRDVVAEFRFDGVPVNSHSVQTAFVATAVAQGHRVGEGPIIYRPGSGEGGLRRADVVDFARHLLALRAAVARHRRGPLSSGLRAAEGDDFGAAGDIDRLATAKYFFDWVLDEFDPYLRGRVLEVGGGTGTITRKLVDRYADVSVVSLEPAANMFVDLDAYARLTDRVSARRQTLAEFMARSPGRFDAVVYLNVLEHIEDDDEEIAHAAEALERGGALLVFGPAMPGLYSDLDHKAGHYRRYTVRRLRDLAERNGFEVVAARYFDVLGVLPYLLVYRLLGSVEIAASTMWSYDRVVVPASRTLQGILGQPPVGKNVIMIARKR